MYDGGVGEVGRKTDRRPDPPGSGRRFHFDALAASFFYAVSLICAIGFLCAVSLLYIISRRLLRCRFSFRRYAVAPMSSMTLLAAM